MSTSGIPAGQPENALFELRGVTKTFASGADHVHALSEVSFSIHAREIFGIIGFSGAGKSTLIRCLNLLERPGSGEVVFQGVNLADLSEKELLCKRRKIGMIFQHFHLLEQRTALGNIRFPLEIAGVSRREAIEKARRLLALVGLSDKEKAYPAQLSGGQKQRVAIARALANDPEVLLCDEATSALDPASTRSILQLLQKINAELGVTVILITHEMSVVQAICQRVAVLDKGRLVELGEVKEVFRKPSSEVARGLILPQGELLERLQGERYLRAVFDGTSAYEPIVANMVLALQTPISILSADSRNIDGIAYGQMILQIPNDPESGRRIREYLEERGVSCEGISEELAKVQSGEVRA